MRWKGRRGSGNVEDRRSFRTAGRSMRFPMPRGKTTRRGGGIGLGGIVVVLLISWVTGVNPLTLLGLDQGQSYDSGPQQSSTTATSPRSDETAKFVSVVLADTENTWNDLLAQNGMTYPEPKLVLFSDAVRSACGQASSAVGPFYCSQDSKIYIDLTFYRQLANQLQAPGDFAQAYVLAHEVGHHLQNVLGVLPEFHKARRGMSERDANALSVRVELQADCFAGIWAHFAAQQQGFVEDGDIEEALNAASRIGDDTLQKQARGYVVPESFNHGTSEQRVRWFREGFKSGRIQACDTFSTDRL
ncbi:zinc metallopeptidase [Roseibium sp. CAU 1637]|uniref:Zinc metallopeptidase n=1 Tax=Roseibium limicola TaxID=2816037 RepID=A0A939EQZ0_9HYPH|nr:neutral zinc metallopeptidase [Roseibium limicola]MBO0346725.1 zinc metallopeptidase [Roseibium limicola]